MENIDLMKIKNKAIDLINIINELDITDCSRINCKLCPFWNDKCYVAELNHVVKTNIYYNLNKNEVN